MAAGAVRHVPDHQHALSAADVTCGASPNKQRHHVLASNSSWLLIAALLAGKESLCSCWCVLSARVQVAEACPATIQVHPGSAAIKEQRRALCLFKVNTPVDTM